MNGPRKIILDDKPIFLTHDYDHVFENIQNKWYTETDKELTFIDDGAEYTAYWQDVIKLYKEDQKTVIRWTKLNFLSVYGKPLQRENI